MDPSSQYRPHRPGRRTLLRAGAGLVMAASATGCDALSVDPAGSDANEEPGGSTGKQAPELARRADRGDLPKLVDRLPASPLVLQPIERTGSFGGDLRMALLGGGDVWRLDWIMAYENLVRWDLDFASVQPNVAESYEANVDGTEYTFRLRDGMKWSDGEPFTVDDIVFAQNDVLNNAELYPGGSENPATAEKVDDLTVRIRFTAPAGLYLPEMASEPRNLLTQAPRHYLEEFHKKYNPDVGATAESEGFSGWTELFLARMNLGSWENADVPTVHAWTLRNAVGESSRVVFDRNPYYWKTDPDGRQLPYLDRVIFEMVNDNEALLLKTMHGDIDLIDRYINRLQNKPVLARSRGDGQYRFFDLVYGKENMADISLNLTHRDPVKREIYQKKDFRIGLSYALNRQKIVGYAKVERSETSDGEGGPAASSPAAR